MDKKLIKEIIKTRNAVRRKFKALKTGRLEAEAQLEETFKPITSPLKELAKKAKYEPSDVIKFEPKYKKEEKEDTIMETPPKRKIPKVESRTVSRELPTSEPKYEKKEKEDTITETPSKRKIPKVEPRNVSRELSTSDDDDDADDDNEFSTPPPLQRAASTIDIPPTNSPISKYMNLYVDKSTKIDKSYGVYFDGYTWKIGNSELKIDRNDIIIKEKRYKATPGLLQLLFLSFPNKNVYNTNDLNNYGAILHDTNAYRRDYEADGQIKGSRSKKYSNIIKKLIAYKGKGLMRLPKENIDHIYWDDPNELVDRLRLLIASKQAGNTSHDNEIVSIIEELREADIIV